MRRMDRHVVWAFVAALTAVVGFAPAGASAKNPPPVTVQASNFRFCASSATTCVPERDDNYSLTVPVRTKVTWVYQDQACDAVVPCPGHNVVFARGGGSSKLVKSDGAVVFSMVFRKAGTFSYFCSAHQSFGMTGTVVVTKR
jgi:plastocyanin